MRCYGKFDVIQSLSPMLHFSRMFDRARHETCRTCLPPRHIWKGIKQQPDQLTILHTTVLMEVNFFPPVTCMVLIDSDHVPRVLQHCLCCILSRITTGSRSLPSSPLLTYHQNGLPANRSSTCSSHAEISPNDNM